MDKPRTNPPKKRGRLYAGIAVVVLVVVTVVLSRLKPAPPGYDRELAWMDTVQLGPMVRQVRGPGTLVPEQIRIIPAVTAGRVEQVLVQPGTTVEAGTLLIRMSNPDVELQLLESQRQLTSARSELVNLTASLQTARLAQEGAVAQLESQHNDAVRQDRVNEELNAKGLITANDYAAAKDRLKEMERRLRLERERLDVQTGSIDAQLEAQRAQVDRLTRIVAFRTQQLESMNVVSGADGVLQRLGQDGRLEIGEYVLAGMELARVVQPGRLKAELRIPETQAVDVVVGQEAEIDTRNGIVMGRVVRIDPAAQGGSVGVDVALPTELPAGARPDLSVDGRVIVDRLENVLFVSRPAYGSAGSTIGLFRLESDGRTATRVTVQLGAASVNEVEIKSGLKAGDVVILSDLSQYDSYERIRLR
jgi:multidrug resistance efflux pump